MIFVFSVSDDSYRPYTIHIVINWEDF